MERKDVDLAITDAGNLLVNVCHGASVRAGWWGMPPFETPGGVSIPASDVSKVRSASKLGNALVGQKLMLIVSEVAEAMEGHRKGLMDDKLPQYPMVVVELVDAAIRIADLAGALIPEDAGYSFGDVLMAKLAFNAQRSDHKIENRLAAGGKAY